MRRLSPLLFLRLWSWRKLASRPPAPQSAADLPDVDSHKAFGSKKRSVAMEVFSDFNARLARRFSPRLNRRLMDDYGLALRAAPAARA